VPVTGLYVHPAPRTGRFVAAANRVLSPPLLCFFTPSIVHETYYRERSFAPRDLPVVLTVYDMIHEKFSREFSRSDITSRAKRAAVARAAKVICISESTRRDLIDLFSVPEDKAVTIHLGVSPPPASASQPIRPPGPPFFLYVGPRSSYKNFDRLLVALRSSPVLRREHDLVAFGGGPFTRTERIRIESLGFRPGQVRQVSGGDDELFRMYRAASAFVYPSLYEGFGIPPLEAMSVGCPVACSNASSLPEVVGSAAVLFHPTQIDSIRQAIEAVASDSSLRSSLIDRGRVRASELTWDKCAAETVNLYRGLIPAN
jgi:glycosyltransferase involved in cell wall biosynthesis